MIKIAVCDDSQIQLEINRFLLEDYINSNNLDATVSLFSHPDELATACETEHFHIYLLDIIMPMMNGLDMARFIREHDKNANIIFITSDKNYALEAFSVTPLHYLIKPIKPDDFNFSMSLAISRCDDTDSFITLKTKAGVVTIRHKDIEYIEYRAHKVRYHLADESDIGPFTISGKFSDYAEEILKNPVFLMCHESYVINIRYVSAIAKDCFTFRDDTIIPIASRRYPEAKAKFNEMISVK